MVHYIYIVESVNGKRYVGVTVDLEERLKKHNHHGGRWTKHKGPWRLIYKDICQNKKDALLRERKIKSYKGGEAFKRLIQTWQDFGPARS